MTEEEWLECNLPGKMIWYTRQTTSDRKRILLGVACLRRIEQYLPGPIAKQAVGLLERYADGEEPEADMARMREDAMEEGLAFPNPTGNRIPQQFGGIAVYYSDDIELLMENCGEATAWAKANTPEGISGPEEQAQCKLIREIVGNPFRPITINHTWLTSTVTNLATTLYKDRLMPSGELDNSCLAVLADALEDAGCDNVDILTHLRSLGPHMRGCFGLDLILGKA